MVVLRFIVRSIVVFLVLWGMFFVWFYSQTGLRKIVRKGIMREKHYEPLENPRIVRRTFETLGPTFIKLGQLIASSPGLFPRRYADEFQYCLDRVKPFQVPQLKKKVEEELGKPIAQLFTSFDDKPLGSASIAQVHAATLPDGREVVVKVQRPRIRSKVDADLVFMRIGAWFVEKLSRAAELNNIRGVVHDFDRTIHEEIDFRKEGQNQIEFNALMLRYGVDDCMAPTPIDGMVTEQVLVMSRFRGFKADDRDNIVRAGIDPETYLRKGLRAWLMTVTLDGFFHGDAHAGNLMMLPGSGPDGKAAIGFLDFGIIGRFTNLQRHQVLRYVLAFTAGDYEQLATVMLEIGAIKQGIDREALVKDLAKVYAPLIEKNLADIKYEEVLPDLTALALRYGIKLPSEFLLILKQLLFFDRYAKLMAPKLNVFSDFGLVDFLFGPLAMKSGLDFNQIMPLLMKIQQKFAAKGIVPGAAPAKAG
ncbi:MAG: AarF/ABC1/UbiB kinase family protein [Deltaproteobacteria bacterium]|nr:AarF/ABC1/UbiB kinase family protein [Deltaproteobacteria bacterium]